MKPTKDNKEIPIIDNILFIFDISPHSTFIINHPGTKKLKVVQQNPPNKDI